MTEVNHSEDYIVRVDFTGVHAPGPPPSEKQILRTRVRIVENALRRLDQGGRGNERANKLKVVEAMEKLRGAPAGVLASLLPLFIDHFKGALRTIGRKTGSADALRSAIKEIAEHRLWLCDGNRSAAAEWAYEDILGRKNKSREMNREKMKKRYEELKKGKSHPIVTLRIGRAIIYTDVPATMIALLKLRASARTG
jgi:hypothetical protein